MAGRKRERLRALGLIGKPRDAGGQAQSEPSSTYRPSLAQVATAELVQKIADAKQRLQKLRGEFPNIWNLRGLGESPLEQQMLRLEQFINECSAEVAWRRESARPEPTIPDALKGSPDIVKRNAIIAQNPLMTAVQLCGQFDLQDVPVVESWRKLGVTDWRSAYKDAKYRARIDKLISKERSRLR
jgi:hypothetical protein